MDALPFSIPATQPADQLLRLHGRTAIVTGGSRGLGEAVVHRLAQAGADVVFTARHEEGLARVESDLAGSPGRVLGVRADVSDLEQSQALVHSTVDRFGGLDILVNNAAVFPPGPALQTDEQTWDHVLDTDTKGAFFLAQFAARAMIARGRGGRIVNFVSTAFINATPFFAVYAIAKAGLWEATRVLSAELAPHGITVNAVTPGATLTRERLEAMANGNLAGFAPARDAGDLGERPPALDTVQVLGMLRRMAPMGRPGYPDDLATAVLFLASELAGYVTGQNLVVDGGQSAAVKGGPGGHEPGGAADSVSSTTAGASS